MMDDTEFGVPYGMIRGSMLDYYQEAWRHIVQRGRTCRAVSEDLELYSDNWLVYATHLARLTEVNVDHDSTDATVRTFNTLLGDTITLLQRVDKRCSSLLSRSPISPALTAFVEAESGRMAAVMILAEKAEEIIEVQGQAHGRAINNLLGVDVKIVQLLEFVGSQRAIENLVGDLVRAVQAQAMVDLAPLTLYKESRDPSLTRWNALLREYDAKPSTRRFARDLDAVTYWAVQGLRAIREDTGMTTDGIVRLPDLRVLDRMMELTTMGIVPTGELYTRLGQQMGDVKASMGVAAAFEGGNDAKATILNTLGPDNKAYQTPMMKTMHQKMLKDNRKAATYVSEGHKAVPLEVHRTNYDYVKALRNTNKLNRVYRDVLEREIKVAEKTGGALPRNSRYDIPSLRKQFSIQDKFTASGRVQPTPGPAGWMWNRFQSARG